jgi:hypothetical protein
MSTRGDIPALPLEIWYIILRYSISVPHFLDPDDLVDRFPPWVLNSRDYSDPKIYYNSESTSNDLRRVCKTWDEYLSQFAHRFVHMFDVVHGVVPVHYLRSALRISFRGHYLDLCDSCDYEVVQSYAPGRRVNYVDLCACILKHEGPLKAEIIDYEFQEYNLFQESDFFSFFPELIRAQGMEELILPEELTRVTKYLPSFRHMHTPLQWYDEEVHSLKSSTLTTLIILFHIPDLSSIVFTDESIQLPALRHLHIEECQYSRPSKYDEPAWLSLLKVVGKELRTLYLPPEEKCTEMSTSGEIWSICPKLEDLYLSQWPPTIPPPIGHPIHTLGMYHAHISYEKPLEDFVPDWPGLRTIRIAMEWKLWTEYDFGPLTSSQLEWLDSRGLCLEDERGESYMAYLSRGQPKIS